MSYKIIVRGTARTEYSNPAELDGISCSDCFTEYLYNEALKEKGISGGYMHFEYNENERKLYTITEYQSEQQLSAAELEILKDYTIGQWGDGIGEGFEQYPCKVIDGEGVYISPWHSGQVTTIYQEEIDS